MAKAAITRFTILQQAFDLIYRQGYQSTSIDEIIATTNVTKGAFFYHFKNKDEMGLAIINEVMFPSMNQSFFQSLQHSVDPVKDIYAMMKHLLLEDPYLKIQYGCPAGNLTQEMSPLNTEFSKALSKLVEQWQDALKKSIIAGKKAGIIRSNVDARQVAYFVMSGYWGVRTIGKLYHNKDAYRIYLKELKNYLKGLKPFEN